MDSTISISSTPHHWRESNSQIWWWYFKRMYAQLSYN